MKKLHLWLPEAVPAMLESVTLLGQSHPTGQLDISHLPNHLCPLLGAYTPFVLKVTLQILDGFLLLKY